MVERKIGILKSFALALDSDKAAVVTVPNKPSRRWLGSSVSASLFCVLCYVMVQGYSIFERFDEAQDIELVVY